MAAIGYLYGSEVSYSSSYIFEKAKKPVECNDPG